MTDLTFVLLDEGLEGFLRRFPAPDPEGPTPIPLTDSHRFAGRMKRLQAASERYIEEREGRGDWQEAPALDGERMSVALGVTWER